VKYKSYVVRDVARSTLNRIAALLLLDNWKPPAVGLKNGVVRIGINTWPATVASALV
jgi:hypothetical protein